jgi:hypothetical protein
MKQRVVIEWVFIVFTECNPLLIFPSPYIWERMGWSAPLVDPPPKFKNDEWLVS